jgi:hypothetical protein
MLVIALKRRKNMQKKNYLMVFTAAIILLAVCIGPAAAYANYEYIWTSSGNQLVEEDSISYITSGPYHSASSYYFTVKTGGMPLLITPFVNSINKNGVHPKVRYLWFALNMPSGVSATYISVFNGPNQVYSKNIVWAGTGVYKEYVLDMGSYKDMNRGINTLLMVENPLGMDKTIYTYGAGAKEEW